MAANTAVDAIPGIVQNVRAAFNTGLTKPLQWRKDQLNGLIRLLTENKLALAEALKKDLGRCKFEGCIADIDPVIGELKYTIANLSNWAAPKGVSTPLAHMKGLTTSQVVAEPKGTSF